MHAQRIDDFARRTARTLDRRGSLKALGTAALVAGLVLAEAPWSTSAKGNKGNGRGKGKGKPKPKPPCSGGACAATPEWAGNSSEIDHCEFVCRQCDGGDPRQFCIRDGTKPDGSPTKVANCCDEGEICCDAHCCPAGRACCRGEHGESCCRKGSTCCGGSCCPTNNPWTACCDGTCVDTEIHKEHCGACGNACLPNERCYMGHCECTRDCEEECPQGLTRCGFECVDTKRHPDHCGGCYMPNPNGLTCCGGNLCTYTDGVCCGGTCYPSYWPSCD